MKHKSERVSVYFIEKLVNYMYKLIHKTNLDELIKERDEIFDIIYHKCYNDEVLGYMKDFPIANAFQTDDKIRVRCRRNFTGFVMIETSKKDKYKFMNKDMYRSLSIDTKLFNRIRKINGLIKEISRFSTFTKFSLNGLLNAGIITTTHKFIRFCPYYEKYINDIIEGKHRKLVPSSTNELKKCTKVSSI